jgi:DNA-binding LytR/AlgR family response regulator
VVCLRIKACTFLLTSKFFSKMSLPVKSLSILLLTPDESFQHLLKILLREIGITRVLPNNNFEEAVSAYNQGHPDICIVDTSELSSGECGVAFANSIREKNSQVPIIFLVDSFKDDCYEKVKSFDQSSILSKEVSKLKLLQAVKYSLLQLDYSKLAQQYSERLFSPEQPGNAASTVMNEEKFFFKIGDSFKAIEKEEISFFFADKKLSHARVGKRNFPTNVQLKTLGDALSPSFLRCHRKYLLNISHIEAISMKEGKVKINGEFLPIGVSYRKSFFGRLNLLK